MRLSFSFAALVAMLALALLGTPASAQNARSWVASNGLDGNPCTRASPCATLNRAFSQTNAGGEINCVDQGDYTNGATALTITRSLTIDCEGVQARFGFTTDAAIVVDASASDIVTLRGLDIDGGNAAAIGISFNGGGALHVENCVIHDFSGSSLLAVAGILDLAANPTAELFVSDTIVTNISNGSAGAGIAILPFATNAIRKVVLNRVETRGNFFGIKADGTQATGGVIQMTIRDSVSSGNASNGIVGTGNANGPAIIMMIDRSTSSHNSAGFGVIADGPKTTIRLGGSSITGNPKGVGTSNGGVLQSYGTNQINGNSNDGIAALTPIGLH